MIDRKLFEEWALLKSLDFKYDRYGVFVWYNFDFWDLDEACKARLFRHYKKENNLENI